MFELNEDMFYFIEAMKVEGYWSIKNREASIQNKDVQFIYHLEKILKKNKINFNKCLLIKVRVPGNLSKEEIRVVKNSHEIKFHFEVNPFDGTRKVVFNLPFRNQKLVISLRDIDFPLRVLLSKKKIITKCILQSFGYANLRFWNIEFLKFLERISNKRNGKIDLTSSIESKSSFIISAFSALVDAEGSIDYYNNIRRIRVRMKDKNYLKKWKKLLSNCGIDSRLAPNGKLFCLEIAGLDDFKKLIKLGFNLNHSEKVSKFRNVVELFTREQLSRNRAKIFYLEELKKIGRPVSAIEFAKVLKKNRRTIYHYLKLLVEEKKIKVHKTKPCQLYSIK